ncbi:hypothetical protein GCM10010278_85890 [Streptomyces melanogenes]|nr:hypothetical protein GCM10010278_85890 [Streptomyces melanogenes]
MPTYWQEALAMVGAGAVWPAPRVVKADGPRSGRLPLPAMKAAGETFPPVLRRLAGFGGSPVTDAWRCPAVDSYTPSGQ